MMAIMICFASMLLEPAVCFSLVSMRAGNGFVPDLALRIARTSHGESLAIRRPAPAAGSLQMVDSETTMARRTSLKVAAAYLVGLPTAGSIISARAVNAETAAKQAPAVMSPEVVFCDQAVSRLVNSETKQEVYIVGTAHISTLSAELVRDTIRLVQPDRVMVELDAQRVKKRAPTAADEASSSDSTSDNKPPPTSVWGLVKAGVHIASCKLCSSLPKATAEI